MTYQPFYSLPSMFCYKNACEILILGKAQQPKCDISNDNPIKPTVTMW